MSTAEHKHAWKMVTHIDACHSYRSVFTCECGSSVATHDERDVSEDPYSTIWMRDDAGAPMCDRCRELLDGAESKHERTETIT